MPGRCLVEGCPYKYMPPVDGCCHTLPSNPTLWNIWYLKSGSTRDKTKAVKYGICSYHFSEKNYKPVGQEKRNKLYNYAIPDINLPTFNSNGITFPFDDTHALLERLLEYEQTQHENSQLQTLLTKAQKESTQLKKELDDVQKAREDDAKRNERNFQKRHEQDIHHKFGSIFTPNQIDFIINNQKWKKWSDIDKAKAIGIYNASSRCYNYLREQLGYPLPSERSIQRWLSKINVQPGLIKPVLTVMKAEFMNFTPMQRMAQLCFDEVSVDSRVELEQKHQIILGPHKNLMAVYVRGLFYSWKQIVYFDFDLRLTKEIIHSILKALYEAGVFVVAITSDMCSVNVRVWKELGINIKEKKFSFKHPESGENVWMFADFSHLLKLLRNHFLDHPIKLGEDFENITIRIEMLEELLSHMRHDIKIAFKLTEGHLKMDKRKRMNVGSARELFSEVSAKSLMTVLPQYKLAAEFLLLVNNVSDIFNVHTKNVNSNPFKCGFVMKLTQQLNELKKFEKNIAELRVLGGRVMVKPFQKGFLLTCGSLKGLFEDMQKPPVCCDYLMTSHILQDYVESGFGAFRSIGGFNDLPMPVDAIRRIKSMIIAWNLRCPKTGNVHAENNMQFLSSERFSLMVSEEDNSNDSSNAPPSIIPNVFRHIDPNAKVRISKLRTLTETDKSKICGSEYIAGFVAKKFISDYPRLSSNRNKVGWVNFLSHGALVSPSKWWLGCFLKFEEYFVAFHRSRYTNKLNLNRESNVISSLSDHLALTFPRIPKPAIFFYVRVRTKLRIQAINKKILVIRRKRRAQSFINSMILAGESDSEDDAPENVGDENFLECAMQNDNDESTAGSDSVGHRSVESDTSDESETSSSSDESQMSVQETLSENNTGNRTEEIADLEYDFDYESDENEVDEAEAALFNEEDYAREYEALFDDDFQYSPNDFEIYNESDVLSAMADCSDAE